MKRLPRNKPSVIRQQEFDCPSDFLRSSEAAHWNAEEVTRFALAADRIVRPKQRRLRWPRRNGVHRYSARSQFKGPAPGEADKRRLCCGVAWRGWSLRSFRHMGYDQDI